MSKYGSSSKKAMRLEPKTTTNNKNLKFSENKLLQKPLHNCLKKAQSPFVVLKWVFTMCVIQQSL